jgi:hypothetical protein
MAAEMMAAKKVAAERMSAGVAMAEMVVEDCVGERVGTVLKLVLSCMVTAVVVTAI